MSPDAISMPPQQRHFLETLAPHLKPAAELHQLHSQARAIMDSLGAAIATAGVGVLLLAENCRIFFANAKAEDLLRRTTGLRCERGRPAAANHTLTHRLQVLTRAAAQAGRAEAGTGATIELPQSEDRPPLIAHIIPLAANRALTIFDFNWPSAAVFLFDPAANFGGQIKRFAARFGLTPAETRVLGEIVKGNGVPAAAAQLKISRATVRTHAMRIFAKTATRRQTELIRRFFETSLTGR